MRPLLDESLPRGLKRHFVGHDVATVPEMGWAGMSNGELLHTAESAFDVFVTADQNLEYQQHLEGFDLGVLVLCAVRTRIDDLIPLIPDAEKALSSIQAGEIRRIALGELR